MSEEQKYKIDNKFLTKSELIEHISKHAKSMDEVTKKAYLEFWKDLFKQENKMETRKRIDTIIVPSFGLIILIVILVLVYHTPVPSKFLSGVIWVLISLASGACAAAIPGFFGLKYKGYLRASGAIGVFVFVYTNPPVGMKESISEKFQKIHLFVARDDTSKVQNIDVDFDLNDQKNINEFTKKSLVNYYGNSNVSDSFTCFRKSDGMIYSNERCCDIKEFDVLIVPNKIVNLYHNSHDAYIHVSKLVP